MSVGTIAARMLIRSALTAYHSHRQEKWRSDSEEEGIEYLASFFVGHIQDQQELRWIINGKIIPKIEGMSDTKLKQLLAIKHKSEKLSAKGKPIETIPITNNTILACHEEYLEILQAEIRTRELKKKEQARAEAYRKARKAYVYENGESDEEIAEKMF